VINLSRDAYAERATPHQPTAAPPQATTATRAENPDIPGRIATKTTFARVCRAEYSGAAGVDTTYRAAVVHRPRASPTEPV
jgi:hypothetical protein